MAPIRDRRDKNGDSSDRKTRKPLVEKRRRARIHESLQELRALIQGADVKMENAEVLEMTVRRVERILQSRGHEVVAMTQDACERFAAGYIQCMHDVHTFVSSCPNIEPSVATELLNHLLESMPLNNHLLESTPLNNHLLESTPLNNHLLESTPLNNHLLESMPLNNEDRLRLLVPDILAELPGWSLNEVLCSGLVSPAPSTSSDDLCSDLEETESEYSHVSSEESDVLCLPPYYSKSVWRPW